MIRKLILWTPLLSIFMPALLFAQELTEFTAEYSASANGISAIARRQLRGVDKDNYEVTSELIAEFAGRELASVFENSRFSFHGNSIQAENYSYRLRGIGNEAKSIKFSWDNNIAVSSEGLVSTTLALSAGTQDPLSYQLAIRLALIENNNAETIDVSILEGDKISEERFTVIGQEELETPMGILNCLKLEKRREEDSAKSTLIWLAIEYEYLIAQIEQNNGNGLTIKLAIQNAQLSPGD